MKALFTKFRSWLKNRNTPFYETDEYKKSLAEAWAREEIQIEAERLRLSFIDPTPLPVGLTEFNEWSDSIIKHFNLVDNGSMRFAMAVKILHLKEDEFYVSKEHVANCMRKAMASQVAAQVIQDLKAKQKADEDAAKAKQDAENKEATTPEVASDGPKE